MPENKDMSERTEIETLLPWYVTGKLDRPDVEKVNQYLMSHPEMAMQLELIRQEQLETTLINEAIPTPSATGIDRLMARLDEEFGPDQSSDEVSWLQSIWGDIVGAFQIPVVQFAGAAAAVLIIVQAVSLGVMINSNAPGSTYTTASGPDAHRVSGTVMLVTFKQSATAENISKLLEDRNGSIIKGPLAGGFYHVKFNIEGVSPEKVDALTKSLETRNDIIGFVSEFE